jgi:hypothetical protein
VAETILEALNKTLDFEDQLKEGERVCLGPDARPASVYDLLRHPQV